jgi:hypothetical protein
LKFGKYITPLQVAIAIEWCKDGDPQWKRNAAARRAVEWLREAGCLIVRNRRNYTTKEQLRAAFPDVWEELEAIQFERAMDEDDNT